MKNDQKADQIKQGHIIANLFKRLIIFLLLVLTTAGGLAFIEASTTTTKANQVQVTLDYMNETVAVSPGTNNSTKFYLSKNNQKTWELIEPNGPISISSLLSSKIVSLYFKGNKDTDPVELQLQAADASLTAQYKVVSGVGQIQVTGSSLPVEYRKGKDGQWEPFTGNSIETASYEMLGTTLYFRSKATAQVRAGKIVTVKIPKRPTAPAVKLDGGTLSFKGLKVGQTQYRTGDSLIWVDFNSAESKVKTLDLKSIIDISQWKTAITVEFRNKATDKKVASSVKVIEILPQAMAPANVKLEGTTLTAIDTIKNIKYEYTIVAVGQTFDMNTAKWVSFTSAKPAVVKRAVVGDKILVRLKATTEPISKNVIPASAYREMLVVNVTASK